MGQSHRRRRHHRDRHADRDQAMSLVRSVSPSTVMPRTDPTMGSAIVTAGSDAVSATFKALIIDGEPRRRAEAHGRLTVSGCLKSVDDLLGALR